MKKSLLVGGMTVQIKDLAPWLLRTALLWAVGFCLAGCKSQAERDAEAKTLADAQVYTKKFHEAQAIFAERCKTAGVVVKRTVQDVEGIQLLKLRPKLDFGDKR